MQRPSLVEQAESLIAQLDQIAPNAGADGRRDRRMPYRRSLRFERLGSGGSKIAGFIYARDLSANGLGALGLEMLDRGAAVSVLLPAGGGVVDRIEASVVHSRHLEHKWHVLGLKFDHPIDPERYLGKKE